MHGIVFAELQRFTEDRGGRQGWQSVLDSAGLRNRVYLAIQEYPDKEVVAIITAIAKDRGQTPSAILENFGEFICPSLIKLYGHLLKPEWRAIDVIDNTEQTVHTVVRIKNKGANPPQLKTKRTSKDEVVLFYNSPRRLCSLAIGIGKGMGKHFGENIIVSHSVCMHKGAPQCEIVFRRQR